MTIKISHELSLSGSDGGPKLCQLDDLVSQARQKGAPDDAEVNLDNYRGPGDFSWSITVEWEDKP